MAACKHHATVIAVFRTHARADRAVAALKDAGFPAGDIGMVTRDAAGRPVHHTEAGDAALTGAAVGAGAGALLGAGMLAGVIPVVGPILALGTLGAVLVNAAGGAALAGLAGALVGWGVAPEDAAFYEGEVRGGKFLVTVEAGDRADDARAILNRFDGFGRPARGAP